MVLHEVQDSQVEVHAAEEVHAAVAVHVVEAADADNQSRPTKKEIDNSI